MVSYSLVILYVDNPTESARFYAALFGVDPLESLESFAMLAVPGGGRLGLWSRHSVLPAAAGAPGCGEIAFTTADVDAVHTDWTGRGLRVIQAPVDLEFGRTFVALDPDGHRLRVYRPGA